MIKLNITTLRKILNEQSILFTEQELNELLDSELEKSPDNMDVSLIDFLLDLLSNKYGRPKMVNVEQTEKTGTDTLISSTDLKHILLTSSKTLTNLNCCNKKIADGVYFYISGSENKIEICNDCLTKLYEQASNLRIKSSRKKVSIFISGIMIEFDSKYLPILISKMQNYFRSLYKQHTRDDLFSNSEILNRYIEKRKGSFGETPKDTKITKNFSAGEKRFYYTNKRLKKDLGYCNKYPIIYLNSADDKPAHFHIFSVLENQTCSFNHNAKKHSVIVISDQREKGFTFSFCENHLLDLATLLFKATYDVKNRFTKVGEFEVEKNKFQNNCYMLMETNAQYKLSLRKGIVFLSKEAFNELTNLILTSKTFSELYPIESSQFMLLLEINENKKRKDNQQKIKTYKALLSEQNNEIDELKRSQFYLERENKVLHDELESLDLENLQKTRYNQQLSSVSENIINCLHKNTTINLGISKKKAKKDPVSHIEFFFTPCVESKTFQTISFDSNPLTAIIRTNRPGDKLCLALSLKDVEILIHGIETVFHEKIPYYDEFTNFSILILSEKNNEHCYFCGNQQTSNRYCVNINHLRFVLCEDCLALLEQNLTKIKNTFNNINKLGGTKEIIKLFSIFK